MRTLARLLAPPRLAGALAAILVLSVGCSSSSRGGAPAPQPCTGPSCAPPDVVSISVEPASVSVAAGAVQDFTATATLSDGTTMDVSALAEWSSSAPAVAAVDAAGGVARAQGIAPGSAQVSAVLGDHLATATMTVTEPASFALSVSCAELVLALGTAGDCTAHALLTDGSRIDVTADAEWATSAPEVASAAAGRVTALAVGTANVLATHGGVSGAVAVRVSEATLTAIAIEPAASTMAAGSSAPFGATGIFSNGARQDLTAQVAWATGNAAIATISETGLVTAVAPGPTTVGATFGGVSAQTSLTVTAAVLEGLDVYASAAEMAKGTFAVLQAVGTWSDDTSLDVSRVAQWSSDDPSIVVSVVDGRVLATAVSEGTANVTATLSGFSGTVTLTVTAAVLARIEVSPAEVTVPKGLAQPLAATGHFSDGTTQDLTQQASWHSSDPLVATVSNLVGSAGTVRAVAEGTTVVTATLFARSASSLVTVSDAVVATLVVTPELAGVPAGYTHQFRALATFSDGSIRDVTADAAWQSSDESIAIVSTSGGTEGLATGLAEGSATIVARIDGVTAEATLTVRTARLVSVAVTPAGFTVGVKGTQAMKATGTFSDGSTLDVGGQANWASSARAVAVVSKQGVVTGIAPGTVTVTARVKGKRGTATGTVQ